AQPLFVQHGASPAERPRLLEMAQLGLFLAEGQSHARLFNVDGGTDNIKLRGLLTAIQSSQMILVPLRCRNQAAGGIFAARLHSYPPITGQDMQFLAMLSRQVAIALDNAEMHEEITASNSALEERVALRSKELMEANTRLLELDRIKSNFISLV